MGTNYYAQGKGCLICKESNSVHIGKASAGWRFLFQAHVGHDNGSGKATIIPKNIKEFKGWLRDKTIVGDGQVISYDDFWEMVEERQPKKRHDNPLGVGNGFLSIDGYDFMDVPFS